jgi:hypothetical protein
MAAFTSAFDLKEYCLATEGREPEPREYWNAACEYMVEKFTYAQHTQPAICAWLKAHDLCSVWGSFKADVCTVCEAAHKQQASA